jgi:hypothetical protein
MASLMIQGSASFSQRVDEYFTEYSFKINKSKIKLLAVEKCRQDRDCAAYLSDDARVLNSLYAGLATTYAGSQSDIEYYQDDLYKAS